MGLNLPTYTANNFSFGPGRVLMGPTGTTPTLDVGAISEDGVQFEITASRRDIVQGNPKLPVYRFTQAQGAVVKFTGIEWNLVNVLPYALGAGVTASAASADSIDFGGDPLVTNVAILVQHQMPVTGQTLNLYAWKCAADAPPTIGLGHDEHQFAHAYTLLDSATNWAGTSLTYNKRLFQIYRQKT